MFHVGFDFVTECNHGWNFVAFLTSSALAFVIETRAAFASPQKVRIQL
jgi:hypothetical protein